MKKRKILSVFLSVIMLLSCFSVTYITAFASSVVAGGWYETIYAVWSDSNAKNASVAIKVSGADDSTYIEADKSLIRQINDTTARVDIPGIKAGTYDIKVTTGRNKVYVSENINVDAYDRSGYAHHNYSSGVGAYNNDGTLKDNAIVIYLTDENKDTITVPGYESYGTGIVNILQSNDFAKKIAKDKKPFVIRVIGTVYPPSEGLSEPVASEWNEDGKPTDGDNGNMCNILNMRDLTVEGIGTDASINGWGLSFNAQSSSVNKESYEVRNIIFDKYPEDALGFQGASASSNVYTSNPIERIWVHNNTFYQGYCENPMAEDKHEGDGSCDYKRGSYFTLSYNYFYDCHKTNLFGSGTGVVQYNVTMHHNFYDTISSRTPMTRQTNIHIYIQKRQK